MIMARFLLAGIFLVSLLNDATAQDRPKLSFGNVAPSEPPKQKTLIEHCGEAAEYAADLMGARQQGVPIYELMKRVDADFESGAYAFLSEKTKDFFYTMPYEYEVASTDRLALKAVAEYGEMIFSGCMQAGTR